MTGESEKMRSRILKKLEALQKECERLYEINGRPDFECGRYDGIKMAIEAVKNVR